MIRVGYICHSHLAGCELDRKANSGREVRQITVSGKVLSYFKIWEPCESSDS